MKKISGRVCGAGQVVDSVNYFKIIGFSLLLSMLGFILPAPDYLQAETVTRKGVVFYDDCEDYPRLTTDNTVPVADWNMNADYSIVVSAEQAHTGMKSYKFFYSPEGIQTKGTNAELRVSGEGVTPPVGNFAYNTEYWMGYSIFIPSDAVFPTVAGEWSLTGQFHAAPDSCDSTSLNPTGAFYFNNKGGFNFVVQGQSAVCSTKERERSVSYTSPAIVKGAWNNVVMNFKFDHRSANNPFFKVWFNGVQFVDDHGINCWNDTKGPYFKIGFYALMNHHTSIYYDEFRIGDKTSDYASMVPGGSSPTSPHAPEGLIVK